MRAETFSDSVRNPIMALLPQSLGAGWLAGFATFPKMICTPKIFNFFMTAFSNIFKISTISFF